MFEIDIKDIFQQKLSDIIVILFTIHLFAVIFTYIIKWVHPHLKSHIAEYNKKKSKCSSECTSFFGNKCQHVLNKTEICKGCEDEITCGECVTGNLKVFFNIADNPSKALLDPTSVMEINIVNDSEFGNVPNQGRRTRDKLNNIERSSVCETNLTINPGASGDYSDPDLMLSRLFQQRIISTSDSNDSFVSTHSKTSTNEFKKELEEIIKEFEYGYDVQNKKINEDITRRKLQNYLKTTLMKSHHELFGENGNQISKENKLLEVAISEFEKELKPVKDQIKILKECIRSFDVNLNTQNKNISDFSSCVHRSGVVPDASSAASSIDLQSSISSPYQMLPEEHLGFLAAEPRYRNTCNKLHQIASVDPTKDEHKSNV